MPKNAMFSFISIPRNAGELSGLREYRMKCPFARAALTVLALCQYSESPDDAVEMLDLLSGPGALSPADVSQLRRSLIGREYVPFSFFADAVPENGYEPSLPLTISIKDTSFSYREPGYATLYVLSSGAETPRSIRLKKEESSGEWFLWDQKLLEPICEPGQSIPCK